MKKEIILHNRKIIYNIRKSNRARRMRLAVYCDESIVVTAPLGLQQNLMEKFIREKANWLISKLSFFRQYKNQAFALNNIEEYIRYKNKAYDLALDRVEYFNRIYKFKYNRIIIKNQKTRWGSCSRKGNLNFNYKIALLPQRLSDYIIVHEICHLSEFNHSKNFWKLISKSIPDYQKIREELKRSGRVFIDEHG